MCTLTFRRLGLKIPYTLTLCEYHLLSVGLVADMHSGPMGVFHNVSRDEIVHGRRSAGNGIAPKSDLVKIAKQCQNHLLVVCTYGHSEVPEF